MSELIPPCFLCKHAEHIGEIPLTRCKITGEIICDRGWINPVNCWKYCPCSPLSSNPCPYFEPIDKEEYNKQLELAKKLLKR